MSLSLWPIKMLDAGLTKWGVARGDDIGELVEVEADELFLGMGGKGINKSPILTLSGLCLLSS